MFIENRQFFNQKKQWINNIIYHQIVHLLLFWMAWFVFLYDFAVIHVEMRSQVFSFAKQKDTRVFPWQEDINVVVISALSS